MPFCRFTKGKSYTVLPNKKIERIDQAFNLKFRDQQLNFRAQAILDVVKDDPTTTVDDMAAVFRVTTQAMWNWIKKHGLLDFPQFGNWNTPANKSLRRKKTSKRTQPKGPSETISLGRYLAIPIPKKSVPDCEVEFNAWKKIALRANEAHALIVKYLEGKDTFSTNGVATLAETIDTFENYRKQAEKVRKLYEAAIEIRSNRMKKAA